MVKRIIALFICSISALSVVFFGGCDNIDCVHDYKYTIVTQPTCERKGEIEGICSLCGKKTYKDIVELGHDYVESNDCCIRCGKLKGAEYLPQGSTFGLTLSDIYNKVKKYNISATTEQEFLKDLSFTKINNLYIKGNKLYFDFTLDKTYCFFWGIEKVELTVSISVSKTLLSINLEKDSFGYKLIALYNDGTKNSVGYFTHVNEDINVISRLVVNVSNELIIIFEDNMVVNLGVLLTSPAEIDDSVLIYEKSGSNAYKVVGIINNDVEEIVIPKTHRGIPVTEIYHRAFKSCVNVKKVVLDKNITRIDSCNFYDCDKLIDVIYKGSEADKSKIAIGSLNENLINATWTYEE